jgi:hypothetical protein
MGGLKINSDDYKWIWNKFLDPDDEAYDLENFNANDIWKDPERNLYKNPEYDVRQFKLSLNRLTTKLKGQIATGDVGKFVNLQLIPCVAI